MTYTNAVLASLLKRVYEVQQHTDYEWQGAVLHLESSSIEYNGSKVELTKNELKVLYFLFNNAGKICSRNDIIDYLWDNQLYVDDNASCFTFNAMYCVEPNVSTSNRINKFISTVSIFLRLPWFLHKM